MPNDLLAGFEDFCQRVTVPATKEYGAHLLWPLFATQDYFLSEVRAGLEAGIHEFIVLKGRQQGLTTICDALDLWYLQSHAGMLGMIVLDDIDNQNFRRLMLRGMLASLPRALRFPVGEDNRSQLVWRESPDGPMRSILLYANAGKREDSNNNLGRSKGVNYLHGDEVGAWLNDKAVSAVQDSLAERHPQRLYIWGSTAQGFGPFRDMWLTAQEAATQRAIFIGWWRHALYRIEKGTDTWKLYAGAPSKEEREWMREVKRRYGVAIAPEQVVWYRYRLAEKYRGDETMRMQEHPCLIGATRVSTQRGMIPLQEVARKDVTESGRVLGLFPKGERDVYRLVTEKGRVLIGTADHPIQCADESFVDLAESAGRLVTLRAPRFARARYRAMWSPMHRYRTTLTVDEKWGRFLGYFMGDGCYMQTSISVACNGKDSDVVRDVRALIRVLFDVDPDERTTGTRRGCTELRVSVAAFKPVMKRLGMWNEEKPHRRVCVPEVIWRSPASVVREFLRGLFEADGFIDWNSTRVLLFSKWVEFLRDVQTLLLGFGITCRVSSSPRRTGDHHYIANELILKAEETRVFNETIGFISARKRGRVHPRSKFTPKEARDPIELIDRVLTVTPHGRAMVYDVGIESDAHTFSAGGIVVHNCLPDDAFQAFGEKFIPYGLIKGLRDTLDTAKKPDGFRYEFGKYLDTTKAVACSLNDAALKVWEEPQPYAVYIVAAHPWGSSSDNATEAVCQVWRAWPDRTALVAEYWTEDPDMYRLAWVCLHLLSAYISFRSSHSYNPVYFVYEIGWGGERVMRTIDAIRDKGRHLSAEVVGRDLFLNMTGCIEYFYRRIDTFGSNVARQSKTTGEERARKLFALRDELTQEHLEIPHAALVDELAMLRLGEEGNADDIGGGAHSPEARAITAAMAVICRLDQDVDTAVRTHIAPKQAVERETHVGEVLVGNALGRLIRTGRM